MADVVLQQRRLTADDYHAMAEAGILDEDDRVELMDGQIIVKPPVGGSHITCVNRLTRLFADRTSADIVISVQNPVRLDAYWEPEPDLALLRPANEAEVPTADRVLLLVEVADTTLAKDRAVKVPRYAAAGIPEVWIVALGEGYVEVYRRPAADGYGAMQRYVRGEAIPAGGVADLGAVEVGDVLGPEAERGD